MKKTLSFFKASMRLWRRHLLGVLIALLGLASAFAVSMLAAFYIYDGVRSDAWLNGVESLYRVENQWIMEDGKPGVFGRGASAPMKAKDILEANMPTLGPVARLVGVQWEVLKDGTPFRTKLAFVDPGFETLVPLPMTSGSLSAIHNSKNAIALSEAEATRLLGNHDLGQTVSYKRGKEITDFQLVAVFRDIPSNSHMKLTAITSWNDLLLRTVLGDSYDSTQAHTYFRMPEGVNPQDIGARITNDISPLLGKPWGNTTNRMTLMPVLGALYQSHAWTDMRTPIRMKILRVLGIVGGLLLMVASFNFINLFTSLNLSRAREVAMRRILGAGRGHLMGAFLLEAGIISLMAFALAILIAADSASFAGELVGNDIPVLAQNRLSLLAFGALLALGVGLMAALYAVGRVSRIQPQSLLHDSQQSIVSAGGKLKAVLVGLQAVAVVGCLLAAGQALYQFNHLMTMDRGMRTQGVLTVAAPDNDDLRPLFGGSFLNDLKGLSGTTEVLPQNDPAFSLTHYIVHFRPRNGGDLVEAGIRLVGPDYFRAMNITPIAKSAEDWRGLQDVIALPRSSLAAFGFDSPEDAIDQYLKRRVHRDGEPVFVDRRIMAVVEDIKDNGADTVGVRMFDIGTPKEDTAPRNIMLIADRDDPAIATKVRDLWATRFPDEDPKIEWLSDRIANFYDNVVDMGEAILIMAGLCLLLCFAGLYGMASHYCATRAREIALRRVLGAGGGDISRLFLRKMLLPVAIGGILALVPTWYLLGLWLMEIEDQAPLPYGYYGLVVAAVLAVAAMILTGQLRQLLRLRPAHVLHHE